MRILPPSRFVLPRIFAGTLAGVCLSACLAGNEGLSGKEGDTCPDEPGTGAAHLDELIFNPKWYRTYDSSNTLIPAEGSLLFSWIYRDTLRHPDSFYVGIDTLWALPQDVGGDTAADWDLQVCPDLICMNGLKEGVHGADAPFHFGGTGEYANPDFETEHHFQFFPAIDTTTYMFTSPDSGIFGALMYVRSRSNSSPADTVFGFGAWKLEWDEDFPPPVRPVEGYLPRRADFSIVGGKVRYLKE